MNLQNLETQYLKAKVAYYEGNPLMSDAAFDVLENELKAEGSKVVEQVGSKRKDFDFPHPSPMLSLAKIQTESKEGITNYQEDTFKKWFNKVDNIIFKKFEVHIEYLYRSPKFDGNGINIVYSKGTLQSVLTRGDGKFGKDITDRFQKHLPETIDYNVGLLEIRCECVIKQPIFDKKYVGKKEDGKYANARNFVAGVLGKDDYSLEKVGDLTIIPVALLNDGKQVTLELVPEGIGDSTFQERLNPKDYVKCIKEMEILRETFDIPLDGVVLSVPYDFRGTLGENEHDPEWAIAIKFVPDEVVTKVVGLEWNISKTGEFTPVVLLNPVELAGTIVKRASGYNAGYIVNNHIGPNAIVSIAKAGDIIPEIQSISVESDETFLRPHICPHCNSYLDFDGIHLTCPNDLCQGKIAKKLASSCTALDLKNVGGKTMEPFAEDFNNIFEVIKWVRSEGEWTPTNKGSIRHLRSIEKYGIKYDSRSYEIFIGAFKNIKSLTYEQVIISLGFDNVGKKLSAQIAREHCGLVPDYTGLERALVTMLHDPDVEDRIKLAVSSLEKLGIKIDKPQPEKVNSDAVYVCMTGSPKVFGFPTKAEFITKFPNLVDVEISDKRCQFLITDSYASTSSKMKTAEKKGITIKTYGDYK
jgi:NAD-dependent DNA ligase